MTPEDINKVLDELFGDQITEVSPGSWKINRENLRLLVLLSDDESWVMGLAPMAPVEEAKPFFEDLLESNFEFTQETRYAIHQGVIWVVYRHQLEGLKPEPFAEAIGRLTRLQEEGLTPYFQSQLERQLRMIVEASKAQGQTRESTLQTLHRFYEEGMMGELSENAQEREQVLAAWKKQLERLWPEV
ncbi:MULTISPECIES: hypothetical protein [unclassified Roseofilum]|uniref:hypothetical protein n=1 Tax=unclassified Roseofilum TaxID=2620099 RepID=UPI000E8CF816|nr:MULTISPECIES: hypothetical protein [unclassified Roseofilum]MBP0008271.1 hypothetical protein [Roseofilum sp. Belize Diploria]MBP0032758.1 hypothetical protein [Roseofilum sp. Belize BBD 4]HBQ98640.1 hypothetical protein [Cyanobacteria bacterium UBA11691]